MVLAKLVESRRGLFYTMFVVLLVSGLWVGGMLLRGWVLGPVDNPIILFLNAIGIDQYLVAGFLLGLYIGISSILIFDPMKQTQGIFLTLTWIVAVIVVPLLASLITPDWTIGRTLANVPMPLLMLGGTFGLLFGLWTGGIWQVIQKGFDISSLRLKRANKVIGLITGLIIVIGFFEAHIRLDYVLNTTGEALQIPQVFFAFADTQLAFNPIVPYISYIFLDIIGGAVFFASIWMFVGYVDEKKISAVGPSRYGKTHFTIGLYDAVIRNNETKDEEYDLSKKHQQLCQLGEWLPATEGFDELWFSYIHGILHKRKRTIEVFDFEGEMFEFIKYGLQSSTKEDAEESIHNYLKESEEDLSDEEKEKLRDTAGERAEFLYDTNFIHEVEDSGVVLMLVDMVKLKSMLGDGRNLVDDVDDTVSGEPWQNAGGSTDSYSWESGDSSVDKEWRSDTEESANPSGSSNREWQPDEGSNNVEGDADDDVSDIDDIPAADYKKLNNLLDADTAIVATKSDTYKSDAPFDVQSEDYSRFQDFIKSKIREHKPMKGLIDRVDLGVYPVYIEGDEDGPLTGRGQASISTYGFDELKKEIER
jgi:hypothetical protein